MSDHRKTQTDGQNPIADERHDAITRRAAKNRDDVDRLQHDVAQRPGDLRDLRCILLAGFRQVQQDECLHDVERCQGKHRSGIGNVLHPALPADRELRADDRATDRSDQCHTEKERRNSTGRRATSRRNITSRDVVEDPSTRIVARRPSAFDPLPYLTTSMWVSLLGWIDDVMATPFE